VVPLFAWYHENLDAKDEDDYDDEKSRDTLKGWTDFLMCKWPNHFKQHSLNPHESKTVMPQQTVFAKDYFASLNVEHLHEYDAPVISFSHFVPRRDLLPAKEFLFIPFLPKVCNLYVFVSHIHSSCSLLQVSGSQEIEKQVYQ
jgi:hypothetical protein